MDILEELNSKELVASLKEAIAIPIKSKKRMAGNVFTIFADSDSTKSKV